MQNKAEQSQRAQQPQDQRSPLVDKVATAEGVASVLSMTAGDIEESLDIFKGVAALIGALCLASTSGQHRYETEGFMALSLLCEKGIEELEERREEIDTKARTLRGELQS